MNNDIINIPNNYLNGIDKNCYGVFVVADDSAFPRYEVGDKVLILKQEYIDDNNQECLVCHGDNIMQLCKVYYGVDFTELKPLNPLYAPIKITEGESFKILGIPKLLIREL